MIYKITLIEALFSTSLWVITFFRYKSSCTKSNYKTKENYIFFCLIITLFSTFEFISGDFFHYYELYNRILEVGYNIHLENFYYNLIQILPSNYYIWRFAIWGTSTIILIFIFKRLNYPPHFTSLIFTLVLMIYFGNPRNTLGYVFLYYSLTFIMRPMNNKKIISFLIAIIGICISTTLHKSIPIYILLLLCSIIPLKKWTYITLICTFPIFYGMFGLVSNFLLALDLGDSKAESIGKIYLESENFSITNINGYIKLIIERTPLLLLLYFTIKQILNDKISDKLTILLSQYSFWLMYISLLLFNQSTSSFLSPRFWDASLYSLVLVLPVSLYKQKSNLITFCYYLLILSNLYNLLYIIYKL